MPEKDPMFKDVTSMALYPLIGAAVLGAELQQIHAQEPGPPAVRSAMLVSTAWLEQHLNDKDLIVLYIGRDQVGSIQDTYRGLVLSGSTI